MPARSPFTALCQLAARGRHAGRADLHVHTTASDGNYTPAQIVDLARRAGLSAVAITDHDTVAAVPAARAAAAGVVEIVPGAEITTEYNGRELHLLAFFVDADDEPLNEALAQVRRDRVVRYQVMVERLRGCGVPVPEEAPRDSAYALGRRNLAELLVRMGRVGSVREAFARYLKDGGPAAAPKRRLPVGEAIALVRGAGGVAAWAHPAYDCTRESLTALRGLGLRAVEVDFPGVRRSRAQQLRAWAAALGLGATGGSDCHGPGPRELGSGTVSSEELDASVSWSEVEMVFRALYDKLKKGLARTRDAFAGVASLFRLRGKVDRDFLAELEKRLYHSDFGTTATEEIIGRVRQAYLDKEVSGDVEEFVKQQLKGMVATEGNGLRINPAGPTVILVAGVNGSGKTTSIAKLAKRCQADGKKVLVAACDTFRAAAVEQLTIWSQRIGCDIVKNQPGSDPASVAHDACEKAKARGVDFLIVDTAGRLHTQANLMRELEKIHRVVSKQIEGAPHEVLLVLDATNGQNAVAQAENFKKSVHCTGIILSKLDGSAKGGAVFAIKQKLDLPVKFVGVGETLDDLEPFDADSYVEALFT